MKTPHRREQKIYTRLWVKLALILALLSISPILGAGVWALRSLEETLQKNERQRAQTLQEVGAAIVKQYLTQGNEKLITVAALLAKELQEKSGDDQKIVVSRLNGLVAPPDIYLELQYYDTVGTKPRFVGAAIQANLSTTDQEARIERNSISGPLVYEPFQSGNNYNAASPVWLQNEAPDVGTTSNGSLSEVPRAPMEVASEPPPTKKVQRKKIPGKEPESVPAIEPASASRGLGLSVPVSVDGRRVGVLVAYLDLSRLPSLLEPLSTGGSEILVFDGSQNVLARAGDELDEGFFAERSFVGYSDWAIEARVHASRLQAALAAVQGQSYVWLGVALLLAIIASLSLAAWIVSPISTLTRAAEAMASGDLKARTNIRRDDEIGLLAAEFDRMAGEVERLDTTKTDFVANVSHELRTPLTSMKLSIANLLDGVVGDITPKQSTTLTRLQNDVSRLIEIVNTLLDLAKLEAKLAAPKQVKASLLMLAKEAASTLEPLAQQKQIRFVFTGSTEAVVDPTMMVRVFFNLFDNAIKFVPAGGEIRVELREGEVQISDTGPGIDIENPFDKFSQGSSRGVKNRGVGLGLSLVRKMVELQGASIELQKGQGAIFVIKLS